MSDKSKQNKDSKSVIKNTDTKAVQKDLSAKADVSKRAVKKERATKKKQIYIPLGLTLSLVLPSFRKADATETDTSSAIAPLESHSKINTPTVHHATETEHSASATSLVQQNIITTADKKDSNSIHSQAHSSNYSHHPVISHPFMNVGYEVANTHASELQGYQTASPQPPTESTVTYREETLTGKYGTLTVGPDGHYAYNLNPKSPAFVLLQGHELGTDSFVIHLSNGLQQTIAVPVTGNNEAAQFSGDLTGAVTEDLNVNANGLITTQGTLAVSDQDHDQDSLVAVHNQATKYGEFSIDESGHWQYQVNNAGNTVQALSSGQMLQETITVHSVDGTEQQIVVTINGQDDTAVISGNDLGSVVEDKQPQVSGKLDVTDPDASQQHFQGGDLVGTLGTLHLQDNGAWTYDLDNTNPTVQALGHGSNATDTITVQSADGTTHQVSITVNGTNDKAVIAGTDSGAVTEESQLQTSGTLTVTDVDTAEAHFSNTDVAGNLGTLHLTDSGAWTYDLDNTNPTVQALGKGATATDIITVQSADGTTHKVTITVNGTNDKAVIAGTDSSAVTEESQLQTSGTLTVTDVDTGEAHFSNTDVVGTLGTLHLKDNGAWSYDLDNTNPTVQALGQGKTATDTITVQSADGTTHKVTITVNGTNDKAVIAGTDSGAVTEESQLQTSGTLTVTDVDTGEAHFSNTDVVGTLGTLHLKDNGAWSYDLDNTNPTVQALGQGKTATDTITVQSADGTTHKVTITVNGTNDKAVIAGTNSGAVTEESQLQTSGTLTVTDVDTGEAHFSNTDVVGNLGTLHLTDSGAWTYDLDNTNPTVQALGKGATATDIITVQSADGTTHKVTITVNGTNDKAVIAGTDSGVVTEESKLQTSGTLTVTDVDTGEAHFSNTDVAGNLGTLHLTDSGAWTYDLDNTNPTVQALGKGATATDTITVHSADGIPHQVKITVNGTNDKAVIAGSDSGAVTEESQLQTSGTLTVTDVDTGEAHFSNTDIAGTLGTLHLKDNGAWTYNLDNTNSKVQALGKGATATDIITVQSADGTPHQVTITVNGTNDKAVIAGTDSGAVTEESQLQTSGTLTVTDVDTGEAHFSNTDVVGNLGTLHLKDNGAWTYDLDNTNPTVQALGKGATATDTITVHSADGTTHKVTITVNGINDKAVIAGTDSGAVTEESQLQTSGTLTVTDVDTGETHFSNTDIAGTLGTLHLTDSGAWTYDLDNTNPTVQALSKGATATDTITVHSADGTPHQVKITVNGTNDKAVIAGTDSGAVTEESQLQTSGTLTVTDVDTGEAHFSNTDVVGTLGTLHLKDNGAWSYDLDNTNPTVQALGQGKTATDTITVQSADGTTHKVTITVNGTNDKAVIAGTDSGAVTEESQLQTSGTLTVTDVDTGEAHFSNIDVVGTLGTLHLKDNGAWTYDLDNTNPKVQALGQGKTATDTITVQSADGTTHQVSITVNGTNDKAVIVGTDSGAVTEESQLQTSGTLTVTDVDTGEAHFSNTDVVGTLGTLHLQDNGAWTYDLDNTNPKVQALGQGSNATDTITVQSADGTTHKVTITVNGTNDKAVIAGTDSGAVTEESQLQTSGTLTVTDVDTGEAHFSNTDVVGNLGTLHLKDNGAWSYDLDNTNPTVQALGQGKTATDTITVQSADGTTHKVTITVNGTNDKAVIAGTDSGVVTEESQLQTSGTLTVTDVDTGEAHFSNTDIAGTLGTLHLTDSGAWTYDLDNTNPTVQALSKGATATDTITVHSADGTPHQVKITVNGTNDKAVIAGTDSGAVTEESQLQTSGTLTVTDVDTSEAHFSNTNVQGTLGTLHLTDSGAWTYDLDNTNPTVQALGNGATATDTITVQSADGTPHQVKITVNGTNDTAVIGGSSTGAVTEETQLQTSGTLTVTDTDTGEAHFANTDIQGTLGTLHLTDNGAWTYNLDNTNPQVQSLAQGATTTDVITVNSADGTPHQITITVNGTNDAAVVGGVDTASVTEKAAGDNMSPDHAQPGMATLRVSTLNANGHLSVVDPDSGQSGFADNNVGYNYHGTYGDLILNPNGDWNYFADAGSLTHIGGRPTTRGSAIDKLGEGETLTDTITVHTKDGTPHNIVITINGSNDRPYCSSEVQLNAGTEDTRQTITAAQLLQNSIDVDKNDSGLLTVANLHPDHGSILDNQDGTYTFTPEKDYNGQVHFTYDVKDAHGGTTHTGGNTTLVATPDKAIISEVTTGSVIEDGQHANHNNGTTTGLANGQLQVIDSDSGEDKFQYSQFGETRIHDPFGGMLRIDSAGNWEYSVDNSALQHLAQGQVETVTYRVHSFDGTAYDLNIDVVGTNDAPTVTKVVLSNGTEDTHYQMQASQFGFTDIDTGDTLHSIAITDLPPATQGKFVLDGHDVTTGQQIPTADISKLQFVPAQDFNGDVQFKYTVNDGHKDSTEATNTLHIDAVGDSAVITGTITGDVDEGHGTYHDRSPNYAQPGMAKLTNDPLYTDGKLEIIDPDTGEAQFDTKGVGYSYHGTYGQLILNADGNWHYKVTVGSNQQNVATQIDQLGDGQQLTDTITVYSKDGTAQDIVITIHGDNDRPYISSEVTLATGTEDTALTFTKADLLANTVDVDANDAGKLSIANLLVDHGSVVDNKDGTYTFTPDKDYNGQVHFTYDVKDAHGGVTHTGASTTLAAVDDKTMISGVDHGVATEDVATHMLTHVNIMDAVDWQALQITDVDSPNTQVTVEFAGKQYTWNIGSGLDVTTPYGKFQFHTIASGSHKGEHSWSYIGDNNNVHVQELKQGESLTESIKLIATDGTEFPITVKVNGTEDGVVIDSKSELGHVVENAQTGASVSGNVVAHDVDLHDTVSWTQTPTGGISGQYGTFHLSADGQWHYDVDQSKATKLGDGDEYWEHFTVEAVSTDGSHVSKSVSVVVHGNNDVPTVSGEVTLPSGKEDTSIHITQAELIANATDVDTSDKGWLHAQNLTADHGSLVSNSDGSFTFNPDPNYNGVVHFTYDVADRHGGIAHTGANTTLTAVNDAAIVSTASVTIDEMDKAVTTSGTLTSTDVDNPDNAFIPDSISGANGDLTIDANGHWVFTANGAFNQLNVGDKVEETFTVTSVDGTPSTIKVTINGTDDKSTVSSATVAIDETNKAVTTSGTLTSTDVDNPDNTFTPDTISGANGDLNIDANGHWVFTANSAFNQLGVGEKVEETFTVTSVDSTPTTIKVTINGTNDVPILNVQQSSNVSGTLTETDLDTNDTHTFSVVNSAGQFGSLSVDPDTGSYVYTPNTSVVGMSYNAATKTYHGIDVFEVKVSDQHSESSKFITFDASGHVRMSPTGGLVASTTVPHQPLVTTAQPTLPAPAGTNVAPTNTVTLDLSSTSDSGSSNTDNITNITTPTITGHSDIPFSTITIFESGKAVGSGTSNAQGDYAITLSSLSDGPHSLTASAMGPASTTAATSSPLDVSIDTTLATPTIDLKGTSDSGISDHDDITNEHTPIITGHTEANANVEITDEHGQVVATGAANASGDYKVTVSALPEGLHTLSVTSTDVAGNHKSADLPLEVDYTAPTISKVDLTDETTHLVHFAGTASQDTAQVTIVVKQGSHVVETLQATLDGHGGYSVDATNLPDGSYTAFIHATDTAGNSTPVGYAGQFDRFSVDTTVSPLGLSLTHDTGVSGDLITHDGALTITGQEIGANIEYSIDGGKTWGSAFTPQAGSNTVDVRQTDHAGNVSTSSSLTFTLDNTALAPSVSLTSDSGDSSSDKLTNVGDLTVAGIEQGATVEYSVDNGVNWNTQFTPIEGVNNVQVRQTDVAGNVSPSTSLSYTLDTQTDIRVNSVTIDQNGPGMFVQVYLPKDSDVTQIEITSDAGGAPLIVDLQTVNRPAPSSSARHPDHQYLEFTHIDLSSLPDGQLTVHVTGQDHAGNTLDTQSTGAIGHPLTWDTSASASDDSNTAIEDSTLPVSGNLLSNDTDAAMVTTTGNIQGAYGVFHLSADGSYTYTLNNHLSVIQQLDSTSQPLVDSITYTASDNHGNQANAHLAISIQGTDDNLPPTVTGQAVSTNEDTTRAFTTSEFGYSDQDGDALQYVTISSLPSHGLLLLNGKAVTTNQQISKADLDGGHLTFTPINNENGANYAQFTFTANDGNQDSASATMILNVDAVNDAPTVGSSFISSLEDKPHAFTTADFKYSDIDGDALNHITITNVAHGVLTLNGNTINVGDDVSASDVSSLIFTPTPNYFSSGVSGLGAVQYTASDGSADSKEGSIFINIANVADPATFGGDSKGVAQEDTSPQTSGTLTVSDPDGTTGFIPVQGGAGIVGSKGYGHAHIDANGHWTYDLYNKNPIVQQLGQGQTDTETITVQSADGTHHDILITITGTNDAPILGVNQTSSTTGTLTETDVDVKDTHTFSVVSSAGQFGSLSVDPNTGDYVYTPNTSITGMSYNAATNSYHGVDVFEVKVSDGQAEGSKFITFDASGHVTMTPTGGLVISTTVPQQPAVSATQPTLPSGTNVAPTNTVTVDLASTSDSGSSNTDNLTNDTTPTITGHTDIPYSQVTVYDGSTPVGHAVSDASGQYSVAVSSLTEGDHNLSAKALAPSSVVPATSSLLSVHIDTQVHVGIQTDPVTADNVVNAQESNSSINITGSVTGDFSVGDIVTLDVNGTQHTGAIDAKGHYSIAVPGSELIADADQKIEASIAVTDTAGNSAHATTDVTYQVDTQVSVPTITFENAGADNLYSKAEIARGQANTITATVTPPGDAKIGEHLVINGQDHVLDAHTLQHGVQIEVRPGAQVQATMTDEHGNSAGSQGFAASAIPEPIIVRPPSGSHQVSGTLGVPPLLPSLTPVPTAQSGWRIHLPSGQYVTSHHGQYGTLTIDPQTGQLEYKEDPQTHTGPHGSASGIGQHEDKFEVALQGTNQDQVVAHVNIQILSHGPGNSGKLTVGTEVVDMTITPIVHTSHPAPPPPPPTQSDESHSSPETIEVTLYADDDNTHHDLMAGLSALADDHSATGSNPYTDIVGLHDAPQADDSVVPTPEPAPDLDLLLNQADDLAHQHPVDAFIDNNGEEHKPDDQHVLDEEHIQHDLPDVMDLPDHHH